MANDPFSPKEKDLSSSNGKFCNRRPQGSWISSSASSTILPTPTSSSQSLSEPRSLCLRIAFCVLSIISLFRLQLLKILGHEQHYVSKLHFSWPPVSCVAGFPSRGIKAVFVSYRDQVGEIQKFALRFSTIYEKDVFINALKVIPVYVYFECMPIYKCEKILSKVFCVCRAFVNLNLMTSLETYTSQMSPSLKNEVDQHSSTQEKETTFTHKFEGIQASLPPSFTALLTDCCAEVYQGRYVAPVKPEKLLILHDDSNSLIEICRFRFSPIKSVDLKSQIVRYMEDSSFQDMLIKVEKVISEIGGDLTL
ncbi:hypothetical protein ACB092_03G184600 [Castanea dentata]